jgi:DNA polymerase zeta
MPLLADTIVECGRRTLHNAIDLANSWGRDSNGKWRECEVIYGDTDSVFIRLPGRSVQEAFRFGEEFCAAVTAANPPPVQLKLEKVYLGSIMQTVRVYDCFYERASLVANPFCFHNRKRSTVE